MRTLWSGRRWRGRGRQQPNRLTLVVFVLAEKRFPLRSIPATSTGKAIDTRELLRRADVAEDWISIASTTSAETDQNFSGISDSDAWGTLACRLTGDSATRKGASCFGKPRGAAM